MMYRVEVRGLRGYGIDYGVCNSIECTSIETTEDKLGEVVMYVLKNFHSQWEGFSVSVERIKGELSN